MEIKDKMMKKRTLLILTIAFIVIFNLGGKPGVFFSRSSVVHAATYRITPKTKPCIKKYAKKNKFLNKNTLNYFTLRSYMEKLEKKRGGTLVLKKGTYYVTNPVFVPSNTTIRLEKGAVVKKSMKTGVKGMKAANGLFYLCKPSKSSKSNVSKGYSGVSNIKITSSAGGSLDCSKTASNAIVAGHNNKVTVSGINFKNLKGGNGIRIVGCSNVTVTGCKFSGVKAADKAGVQITNPDVYMDKGSYKWMKKDGVPCKNIKVEKCTFTSIGKGVATSQFTKNKFHTGIKITGNKFSGIKTEALRVINWSKPQITNNTFNNIGLGAKISKNNLGRGIFLLGVKEPVITGNRFSNLGRIVHMTKFKNDNKTARSKYGVTQNVVSSDNLSHILKDNTVYDSVMEAFVRNNKTYGSDACTKYYIRYDDYYNDDYTIGPGTAPFHHEYMADPKYDSTTKNFFTMQSYMSHLERRGGGVLRLKAGEYSITQMVCIPSNVQLIFQDGVKIKAVYSDKYLLGFADPSTSSDRLAKGYSGVSNSSITAETRGGATIDMKGKECNAVAFAHNTGCTVSNIHFTGRHAGHYLEVDASKDCICENCDFDTGTADHKEAINLDTPDPITEGFTGNWSSLDCTANLNFIIRNCSFRNMKYAIGTHSYSYGHPHKNTQILDCTFDNVTEKVIQPMNWENTTISGNTFNCTPEEGKAVIIVRGSRDTHLTENSFSVGDTSGGSDHVMDKHYALYFSSAYHTSGSKKKLAVKPVNCGFGSDYQTRVTNADAVFAEINQNNSFSGTFDRRVRMYADVDMTTRSNKDEILPVRILP